uniref:Uncharacterized protein n=1 Tax=Vannella robusta TaxID=1487602 RepID=A0A7S4INZ6_9EUKA|mmetsp:Transcript_6050/g.7449  ORF Transcript_6050/g.7449 Transcript_6050/m.7449 type:complete len:369 (+) Transcript_6050:168-1274(+)
MLCSVRFCFFCMLILSVVLPSSEDNQRNLEELGVAGDFSNLSAVHSGYIIQLKKRKKQKSPWCFTSFAPKFYKNRQLLVQVPPLPYDVTIRFLIEPLFENRDVEFVFDTGVHELTQECKISSAVREVSAVLRTKREEGAPKDGSKLTCRISVWAESPDIDGTEKLCPDIDGTEKGKSLLFHWEAIPWRNHNSESKNPILAAHIENTAVVHVCLKSYTPTILQPLVTLALEQPNSNKKRKPKQTDSNVPAKRQRKNSVVPPSTDDIFPAYGRSIPIVPSQPSLEQETQSDDQFTTNTNSVPPTYPVPDQNSQEPSNVPVQSSPVEAAESPEHEEQIQVGIGSQDLDWEALMAWIDCSNPQDEYHLQPFP